MKSLFCLLCVLFSSNGAAQLAAEFDAVACKPVATSPDGFSVEKQAHDVSSIVVEANGQRSTVVRAVGAISNAIRSPQGDYIAYFLVNPKAPKLSGWNLQRLSNGHSAHVADGELPPKSACFSPDGKKLAFVNQSFEVVQIDLDPAYERLNYHDRTAHQ